MVGFLPCHFVFLIVTNVAYGDAHVVGHDLGEAVLGLAGWLQCLVVVLDRVESVDLVGDWQHLALFLLLGSHVDDLWFLEEDSSTALRLALRLASHVK